VTSKQTLASGAILGALGVALVALAGWADRVPSRKLDWASRLWGLGTVIFSGSLYLLVLLDQRWLGAVTPFGGVALIAGWLLVAASTLPSTAAR
jgi:uncharacterized membrane protein YgdD (TMEM256/DUF423 family)